MSKEKTKAKRKKLSRLDVIEVKDLQEEWVYIEEWKGEVLLRSISMQVFASVQKQVETEKLGDQEFGMLLISKCLIDPETDAPMFTFADTEILKGKNIGALVQLINAVNDVNGLSEEAKKVSDAALLKAANGAIPSS